MRTMIDLGTIRRLDERGMTMGFSGTWLDVLHWTATDVRAVANGVAAGTDATHESVLVGPLVVELVVGEGDGRIYHVRREFTWNSAGSEVPPGSALFRRGEHLAAMRLLAKLNDALARVPAPSTSGAVIPSN